MDTRRFNEIQHSIQTSHLGFRSRGFYAGLTVLGWKAFWELADQHQNNWGSILLAWTAIGLCVHVVIYL